MVSKPLCTENFIDTIDYVATDQNGLTATSTRSVLIEASSRCLFDPLQPRVTLLNLWTAVFGAALIPGILSKIRRASGSNLTLWCPRLTAAMMFLGFAVEMKGLGVAVTWLRLPYASVNQSICVK